MDSTLGEIASMIGLTIEKFHDLPVTGISTDSRQIKKGMVFVALKGNRFDGHDFIDKIAQKGAIGAIVSQEYRPEAVNRENLVLMHVEDTLSALHRIASVYRDRFEIPIIAVTGTNGKTTTKEMIYSILSSNFRTAKSSGNYNNHIGVPLTITCLSKLDQLAVIEMGTNHFGEIKRLCSIVRPTCGVITNVGKGHLEFFKDEEGVARAKAELIDFLETVNGAELFLNGDDPHLKRFGNRITNTTTFGFSNDCSFRAEFLGVSDAGFPMMKVNGEAISLSIYGRHNLYNALAAAAVARSFGIDWKKIKERLESYRPFEKRMEIIEVSGIKILNDTYNSNPSSLYEALLTLKEMRGVNRRIVVLGDMLELGTHSIAEHTRVGDTVYDFGMDIFYCFGNQMRAAYKRAKSLGMEQASHYESKGEILNNLSKTVREGDAVLIKGSRGMKMEDIVDGLMKNLK